MGLSAQKLAFGVFRPKGLQALMVAAAQSFLGRGKIKKALSFLSMLKPNQPFDIDYYGIKLRLYPLDNTIENKILFSNRQREQMEINAIKAHMNPQGVFVDIGANIGYYSLMAAKLGYQKIIAFEPSQIVLERFAENIRLNGFQNAITVYQCCVGEIKGRADMVITDHDLGGSSAAKPDLAGSKLQVDQVALKDVMIDEDIERIDCIKIDVEGLEDRILFSYFADCLKQCYPRMIIIEDNSTKGWQKNILHWLLKNGYQTKAITRSNHILLYAN
ncbi:MAG: FkbM family methyltransferase [Alphaproteobacteria bacterium]